MRYRALDENDDYTAGAGVSFYVDSPAAVAQAVKTRLRLLVGEWFLDRTEGLATNRIVGVRTQGSRDQEIQQRILGTQGVQAITQYSSSVDSVARTFTVDVTLVTVYGAATISITEAI